MKRQQVELVYRLLQAVTRWMVGWFGGPDPEGRERDGRQRLRD